MASEEQDRDELEGGGRRGGGLRQALSDTKSFYQCVLYFWRTQGTVEESGATPYADCPYFKDRTQAKVQCYSVALIFYLWSKPHYRNGSFQEDMVKNLRNVAVPGSGVPLSLFCHLRATVALLLLVINPWLCLVAALHGSRKTGRAWGDIYSEQLLEPRDWFSYWRLNCRLASYHSLETKAQGYEMENKWTFLTAGEEQGVPVSPSLDVPALVIKDQNEEGGMGIFFYKNAREGGSWIIQERLHNSPFVASILPPDTPLSTMRVITASRWWLEEKKRQQGGGQEEQEQLGRGGRRGPKRVAKTKARGGKATDGVGDDSGLVEALSCVFRAGMAGASTDHSSILFDVDQASGEILKGTTNNHWYELGPAKALKCPWLSTHDTTAHPDSGGQVSGAVIPDMTAIIQMVKDSHWKLLKDVPLVGWDVAMCESGTFLLEVNLSCNFFRGSFDNDRYVAFVHEYFVALEQLRAARVGEGGTEDKQD